MQTSPPIDHLGSPSCLAGEDLGSRNSVAVEVVVDVGGISRIRRLNVSWDLDRGRCRLGAAASNLELSASN